MKECKHVVIIDDDEEPFFFYTALKKYGYKVTWIKDTDEACLFITGPESPEVDLFIVDRALAPGSCFSSEETCCGERTGECLVELIKAVSSKPIVLFARFPPTSEEIKRGGELAVSMITKCFATPFGMVDRVLEILDRAA